jgi:hypothetical protein
MARTVLTAAQLPSYAGGVNAGAGVVPDHTNGNIVASPGPFRSLIVVSNTGSAVSLIVRASGYQGTPTGAANSGYVTGQYQPFATASIGDLTVSCTADVTTVVDLEGDTERFTQSDGSMWLDWAAATTDLLVWVAQRPYMP